MKELVTLHQAEIAMIAFAIAAALLGPLIGRAYGKTVLGVAAGLAIGLGNLLLWHLYNAITNRLGLDTTLNFTVQLLLFVAIGTAAGLVVRHVRTHG